MEHIRLEPQFEVEPLDEATLAALDEAQAEADRGETIPLAQVRPLIRKQYQAWLKTQKEILTA